MISITDSNNSSIQDYLLIKVRKEIAQRSTEKSQISTELSSDRTLSTSVYLCVTSVDLRVTEKPPSELKIKRQPGFAGSYSNHYRSGTVLGPMTSFRGRFQLENQRQSS